VKTVEQKISVPVKVVSEEKPVTGTWKWSGAPDYKNERLAYYQDQLTKVGITDSTAQKWLVAQLVQENGSMNEAGIYHNNCVFGIPQINTCGRFNMKADRYLQEHPEWKDWRYQIEQMAVQVKTRYDEFNEISCTIVGHFHPNGSNGARGLYKRNGHCKTHQYYHTHVAQRLKLLTL
jgi:hypothetical protein